MLNSLTSTTGSADCLWYASARNSSIAFDAAYDHLLNVVEPYVTSSSSLKGTRSDLPYTSDELVISRGVLDAAAALITAEVSMIFVSIDLAGSSTINLTPTAAARWYI